MARQHTTAWIVYAIIILWLAAIYGWVMNILTIFNSALSPLTGEMAIRIIGVFIAPIGAVLGYF